MKKPRKKRGPGKPNQLPIQQRFACSLKDAAQVTSISVSKLKLLMQEGAVESRRIGRRRLLIVASLKRLIENGPQAGA